MAAVLKSSSLGPSFYSYVATVIWTLCLMAVGAFAQPAFAVQMCNQYNTVSGNMLCGDGKCQVGEVCDDGSNNSDSRPNACRTDCRYAYCRDGVIDAGEQCDDGLYNIVANKCRPDCTLPRCGDAVTDNAAPYNEQCDDGNNSNMDGCLNSCKSCVMLGAVGNIEITDDTQLCAGEVRLDDYGDYGTVIIKRSGITLDCNGLALTGEGRGVGIMIFRSNDVTIKNCQIYGYDTGIKGEDSNNVTLINNRLCGNSVADIDLPGASQMAGNANACGRPGNWNDTGKTGCSQKIAICNPPSVSAEKLGITSQAGALSLKNMPQVTVQPRTPSKPATTGKMQVQQAPVKSMPSQAQAPASVKAVPMAPVAKPQKVALPDMAITRLGFTKECRVVIRIENKGAPLSKNIYRSGGVYLQRFEDGKRTRSMPIARLDPNKALLTGRGIGWTDSQPVKARKELRYALVGVGKDANPGNNQARTAIPPNCQQRK